MAMSSFDLCQDGIRQHGEDFALLIFKQSTQGVDVSEDAGQQGAAIGFTGIRPSSPPGSPPENPRAGLFNATDLPVSAVELLRTRRLDVAEVEWLSRDRVNGCQKLLVRELSQFEAGVAVALYSSRSTEVEADSFG